MSLKKLFTACYFVAFFMCCSGGPLLDSKGNLIGINTAIFTQTGYFTFFCLLYMSYTTIWNKNVGMIVEYWLLYPYEKIYFIIRCFPWPKVIVVIKSSSSLLIAFWFYYLCFRYFSRCRICHPILHSAQDCTSADPVWQSKLHYYVWIQGQILGLLLVLIFSNPFSPHLLNKDLPLTCCAF